VKLPFQVADSHSHIRYSIREIRGCSGYRNSPALYRRTSPASHTAAALLRGARQLHGAVGKSRCTRGASMPVGGLDYCVAGIRKVR